MEYDTLCLSGGAMKGFILLGSLQYIYDNNFSFIDNYYNIINQNYIIFIQKIFEFYGIKYIMIDGFDIMVNNPNKIDDKTHLINKNNYWGFGIKTSRELINESALENKWEVILPPEVAPHPNKNGYYIISEELYNYIKTNKLL
jgi:hypothetical protein